MQCIAQLNVNVSLQLQELKQRASGNMDEPLLNPGISEKQPLHVVMVTFIANGMFSMLYVFSYYLFFGVEINSIKFSFLNPFFILCLFYEWHKFFSFFRLIQKYQTNHVLCKSLSQLSCLLLLLGWSGMSI